MSDSDILLIDQLKSQFKDRGKFTTSELHEFYQRTDPDVKPKAITWRINKLLQDNHLFKLHRGVYSFSSPNKTVYIPNIRKSLVTIAGSFKNQFPEITYCIWDFTMVNEFTQHLINQNTIVLEVDSDASDDVFYYFQSVSDHVIVRDSLEIDKMSIGPRDELLIIKNLITEAPLQSSNKINTLTLEKLLVDIVADDLLANILPAEKETIIQAMNDKYVINSKAVKRYANRRNAWLKVEPYISSLANGTKS